MDSKGHLISGADRAAVALRFGDVPLSPAVPILGPPPQPADSDSPDVVINAHAGWYDEWHALRRRGIGASEVASVAGIPGAYGSPFALWWQKKTGMQVEQDTDEILVMGTRLEAVIGETWQERNPEAMLVRPGAGLFQHRGLPWLVATPDFLAVTTGTCAHPETCAMHGQCVGVVVEPVECKAYDGGRGWGRPGTDQIPEHVLVQILMQCDVLGARRGHVVRMQGKRVTSYVVDAYPTDDEGRRRALVEHWQRLAQFFVESLADAVPPAIDGSDATESILAQQYSMVEGERAPVSADLALHYRAALDRVARAKESLAQQKNLLRAAMGTAQIACDPDGNLVATRRVYKRNEFIVPSGVVDGIWPIGGTQR